MNTTNNNTTSEIQIPQWMIELHYTRKRLFLTLIEPIIVFLLGPSSSSTTVQQQDDFLDYNYYYNDGYNIMNINDGDTSTTTSVISMEDEFDVTTYNNNTNTNAYKSTIQQHVTSTHRRLGFLPSYVEDVSYLRASSMSFATLTMMYVIMSVILLVFLSCFYHNQKTSPLFVSPRRHRLPKLVPPPLPVDGAFSWVKVCLFMSDEEVREEGGRRRK